MCVCVCVCVYTTVTLSVGWLITVLVDLVISHNSLNKVFSVCLSHLLSHSLKCIVINSSISLFLQISQTQESPSESPKFISKTIYCKTQKTRLPVIHSSHNYLPSPY